LCGHFLWTAPCSLLKQIAAVQKLRLKPSSKLQRRLIIFDHYLVSDQLIFQKNLKNIIFFQGWQPSLGYDYSNPVDTRTSLHSNPFQTGMSKISLCDLNGNFFSQDIVRWSKVVNNLKSQD